MNVTTGGSLEIEDLLVQARGRHPARVAEHAGLGRPGRAGGVDQRRQIAGVDLGHALVDRAGIDVGAGRAELLEREGAGGLAGEQDRMEQLGAAVPHLRDLRELLRVLAEHEPAPGVAEHVLALLRGVGVVDRRGRGAGAHHAGVRDRPLGTRVGQDRDAVAVLDAERDQPARDALGALAELAVAEVDPAAALLPAEGGGVRARPARGGVRGALRAAAEHLAERAGVGGPLSGGVLEGRHGHTPTGTPPEGGVAAGGPGGITRVTSSSVRGATAATSCGGRARPPRRAAAPAARSARRARSRSRRRRRTPAR